MSNPNVNLSNLDSRYSKPTDVAAAISAQATTDAGKYLPLWKPTTLYSAGQPVVNPTGQIVTANTTFTSSASYNASNWSIVSDPAAVEVVTYSGSLGTTRPTAPAVYWVGFPSTPTNAQSQDIVAAAASPRIISEYSGATNLTAQAFPTSGGKSPTSVMVDVMIAPGAGGGSGRRGAAGTVRCGGGAGAGGGIARNIYIPASLFGPTWSLIISAAGTGGAAATTDDTNGNDGGSAGNVSFNTLNTVVLATPGAVGRGGTATTGAGSAYTGNSLTGQGGNGAAASTTGGPGVQIIYYGPGPAGGSSGGGITSANVASPGAIGGSNPYVSANGIGAAGAVDGALPTSGTAAIGMPGDGAGSGAASITRAAQAGANATGYGAGGSGGGASLDGYNSGAGGNGGPGFVRLIWDYS